MATFWALMAVAAVAAVADWVAVGTSRRRLEYGAKPAVLAALVAAAAAIPADQIDLVDRRWWFVAALVCCLAGDALLMLPRDRFIPGLAAFLVGHGLFIVGLLQAPAPPGNPPFSFSATGLAVAAAVVVAVVAWPGSILIRSLARGGQPALMGPVCLYMAAIATMAVLAANVGIVAAAVGAGLFLLSDTLLGLDRFVRPIRQGTLAVHVTYHLAQGLLVLSLLR
ncbi:MAG TPA: lysoplasmalogenase [Acidimicrobiales bacterium]